MVERSHRHYRAFVKLFRLLILNMPLCQSWSRPGEQEYNASTPFFVQTAIPRHPIMLADPIKDSDEHYSLL